MNSLRPASDPPWGLEIVTFCLGWGLSPPLRRFEPTQQSVARVMKTPSRKPGKKPTRIAGAGNVRPSSGFVTGRAVALDAGDVDVVSAEVGTDDVAADGGDDGDDDEDIDKEVVFEAFFGSGRTQNLFLQVNPDGQQFALPSSPTHSSSLSFVLSSKFVESIEFRYVVEFCS